MATKKVHTSHPEPELKPDLKVVKTIPRIQTAEGWKRSSIKKSKSSKNASKS